MTYVWLLGVTRFSLVTKKQPITYVLGYAQIVPDNFIDSDEIELLETWNSDAEFHNNQSHIMFILAAISFSS